MPGYYHSKNPQFISEDTKLIRLGMLLVSFFTVIFLISEPVVNIYKTGFYITTLTRVVFLVFSVYSYFYLRNLESKSRYTVVVFAWTLALVIMISITDVYRRDYFPSYLAGQDIVVFLIFLVFRNKLILQLIPALILSCNILIELLYYDIQYFQFYIGLIVSLIAINIFGIIFSKGLAKHRLNIIRIMQVEQELRNELKVMAFSDTLTGLNNRRMILNLFATEFQRVKRYGTPLTIILLDLDLFKDINDKHGHQVGDLVLIEFSRLLLKIIRENDQAGRVGGEEFLLLLPQTRIDNAIMLARRIKDTLNNTTLKVNKLDFCVTASMGITEVSNEDQNIDSSLRRADRYMYMVKNSGRNNYIYEEQ